MWLHDLTDPEASSKQNGERMPTRITMPTEEQLPPGPLRELISGLHRLYMDAGAPSSRQVSAAIGEDPGARGRPSHETVSAILRRPGQVPRWENVQSIVRTLASWSHRRPDIDAEVSRFHQLWQAAELTSGADEAETGTPWYVDPADYSRPLPKAMAAQTEPHSFVALLEQMDNEGQDRLLPPLAAALWRPPQSAKYCIEVIDEFLSAGRSKAAHTVLTAGALSYQFQELSAELHALGRYEADQVIETAHRSMPLPYVWEHLEKLVPDTNSIGGMVSASLLFGDMTRHREPSEIVSFLTSNEFRTGHGDERAQLVEAPLIAIATTYGEEQLPRADRSHARDRTRCGVQPSVALHRGTAHPARSRAARATRQRKDVGDHRSPATPDPSGTPRCVRRRPGSACSASGRRPRRTPESRPV